MRVPYRPDALNYPPENDAASGEWTRRRRRLADRALPDGARWWQRIFRMIYVFV